MKISDLTIDDIRDRMGGDASRADATAMRAVVLGSQWAYVDTADIPEREWLDMLDLATQPTYAALVRDMQE